MSKSNELLVTTWNKLYPDIECFPEYKPWELEYVAINGTTKGIRAWMKANRLQNFAIDMVILPETLKISVEVQGLGGKFSHRGSGQTRDCHKNNQLVMAGWRPLVYPAQEVKDHCSMICEDIEEFIIQMQRREK